MSVVKDNKLIQNLSAERNCLLRTIIKKCHVSDSHLQKEHRLSTMYPMLGNNCKFVYRIEFSILKALTYGSKVTFFSAMLVKFTL